MILVGVWEWASGRTQLVLVVGMWLKEGNSPGLVRVKENDSPGLMMERMRWKTQMNAGLSALVMM